MRRTFPRTSGSPQAPAIVETPAHYAPTLFLQVSSFVRGGDWKCRAYYVLALFAECWCKITHISSILVPQTTKIT